MAKTKTKTETTDDGQPSFDEAMAELEAILGRIEGEEGELDELTEQVGRAAELIQLCRGKLRKTDTQVRKIIDGLEEAGEEES